MLASVTSGDGLLASNTRVESIDSATQLTLTLLPETGGASVLTNSGTEYTDGVEIGA